MKNILVLCTGNSCRNQMAEGWIRYYTGDKAKDYCFDFVHSNIRPLIPGDVEDLIEL
jgi:arsenate reductase